MDKLLDNVSKGKLPAHVAITLTGINKYLKRYNKDLNNVLEQEFKKIFSIIELQLKLNIPILTVHLMSPSAQERESYSNKVDHLIRFIEKIHSSGIADKNKIKVSVLGKWYDLPGRAVEPIKKVVTETKDYDSFFLNLCVLYDGREEILDAFRILGKKIASGQLDPDAISEEDIKDNVYASYFLPPDIIIKTGKQHRLNAFLLWDSVRSYVYFPHKYSPECSEEDFLKAITKWQEAKLDLKKWKREV